MEALNAPLAGGQTTKVVVALTSILHLGVQRPEKRILGGTGSQSSKGCVGEGSARSTTLGLAGCVSLKGRMSSFSLDDKFYKRFIARVRNEKKSAGSQWRKGEHLV